jgi:hypothetical protein
MCLQNYYTGHLSKSKDSIVIMSGVYTILKNQRKVCEETFSNGKPVYCKTYYRNGNVNEFGDFTKKFESQECSYYVTMYNESGKVEAEGFIYIVNNKIKVPEFNPTELKK